MIRSFGDRETEQIFSEKRSRRIPSEIQERALAKLRLIDAASVVDDLRVPPSNRLHLLRGTLSGYHAIRINDQWRIVFRWKDGGAEEVTIKDYH
ncbi:MAG TPA: type II toxin-antitoxin system RelE/ParE family toxin [Verrucomicrobiales bacterium]|jgi:proteic killer suppression protein|nr:type II toxin-antitoxin system RelE/ParE family toxin [Verrucomicrobiales bacterium]